MLDARLGVIERIRRIEHLLARSEQARIAAALMKGFSHELGNQVQILKLSALELARRLATDDREGVDPDAAVVDGVDGLSVDGFVSPSLSLNAAALAAGFAATIPSASGSSPSLPAASSDGSSQGNGSNGASHGNGSSQGDSNNGASRGNRAAHGNGSAHGNGNGSAHGAGAKSSQYSDGASSRSAGTMSSQHADGVSSRSAMGSQRNTDDAASMRAGAMSSHVDGASSSRSRSLHVHGTSLQAQRAEAKRAEAARSRLELDELVAGMTAAADASASVLAQMFATARPSDRDVIGPAVVEAVRAAVDVVRPAVPAALELRIELADTVQTYACAEELEAMVLAAVLDAASATHITLVLRERVIQNKRWVELLRFDDRHHMSDGELAHMFEPHSLLHVVAGVAKAAGGDASLAPGRSGLELAVELPVAAPR